MVICVEHLSLLIVFYCGFVCCLPMQESELAEFDDFLLSTVDGEPSEDFDELYDDTKTYIWEHSGKFEGDIVLSDKQRTAILENVARPGLSARNGLKDSSKRWPGATLVYRIVERDFSSDQIQAIRDGMDDLERTSCVKFREKGDNDDDFVEIHGKRRGCFSQVGHLGRGRQLLNLTPHPTGVGCMRHGTIVHELLHSLGFFHMQSDTERDNYVKIEWDNILDGRENNFKKYNSYEITDFGVPYDYDSVLHYSAYAFSKNGRQTIVPKTDGFVSLGQRTGLSDKDVTKLNKMYKCDGGGGGESDETNDSSLFWNGSSEGFDDEIAERNPAKENSDETNSDDGFQQWGKSLFPKGVFDFTSWWK